MFVRPASVSFVIEVVNAWSPTVRTTASDHSAFPDLADLCRTNGVEHHEPITDEAISVLAEELHRVFATTVAPIDVLADLVDRLNARATIDADGAGWNVPAASWLRGTALAGLVEHARTDPHLDRLGTCTAHNCVDAYLDATQAATKQYCSATCQTRAKAAARRNRLASTRRSSGRS